MEDVNTDLVLLTLIHQEHNYFLHHQITNQDELLQNDKTIHFIPLENTNENHIGTISDQFLQESMRLSDKDVNDMANEKVDKETRIKTEILEDSSNEIQPDILASINACNIDGDYNDTKIEVKYEEIINNKLCEFQESDINCLSYESAEDEKDFVINIIPVADDELISNNMNIQIKNESDNQVSVCKQPFYPVFYYMIFKSYIEFISLYTHVYTGI